MTKTRTFPQAFARIVNKYKIDYNRFNAAMGDLSRRTWDNYRAFDGTTPKKRQRAWVTVALMLCGVRWDDLRDGILEEWELACLVGQLQRDAFDPDFGLKDKLSLAGARTNLELLAYAEFPPELLEQKGFSNERVRKAFEKVSRCGPVGGRLVAGSGAAASLARWTIEWDGTSVYQCPNKNHRVLDVVVTNRGREARLCAGTISIERSDLVDGVLDPVLVRAEPKGWIWPVKHQCITTASAAGRGINDEKLCWAQNGKAELRIYRSSVYLEVCRVVFGPYWKSLEDKKLKRTTTAWYAVIPTEKGWSMVRTRLRLKEKSYRITISVTDTKGGKASENFVLKLDDNGEPCLEKT